MKNLYAVACKFLFALALTIAGTSQNAFSQTAVDLSAYGNSVAGTYPLNLGTGFTVEYWFKLTASPTGQVFGLFSQGVSGRPAPLDVFIDGTTGGGKLVFSVGNGSSFTPVLTSFIPVVGTWYHVAHTFSAGVTSLYVNGAFVTSAIISPSVLNNVFFLGNRIDGSLEGAIMVDELRIWDNARTQPQISTGMNGCFTGSETGLAVYYRMNEATGNTLTDFATANGVQNGTIQGGFGWTATSPIPNIPVAPTASTQTFCSATTAASLVPAMSTLIKWYAVATGGTALISTASLANGVYYVASTNANGCESGRTAVVINNNLPPAISYAVPANFCTNSTIVALSPTNTGGNFPVNYITAATLAGGLTPGYANGTGTAAQFYGPTGVATDAAGNVYVADANSNKIRKITPAGLVTTWAGSGSIGFADGTGTAAQFSNPTGVAADAAGNIYVADNYNNRIRKISPAGLVTTLAGTGVSGFADGAGTAAQFAKPSGVATDAAGNVYVADANNNRIRKITPAGVVITLAGSGVAGFADGSGTAAQFSNPWGVATDAAGNVYVADRYNHRIRKITTTGVVTTLAGSGVAGFADGTGTAAQFYGPTGVVTDAVGNMYVADFNNNRIRKITPAAVVSSLGNGGSGYVNGNLGVAKFNYPQGIAIDAYGILYIADASNNIIRKITGPATFTVSPALPAGLSIDAGTGAISGTPTVATASTTYTISAVNSCGTSSPGIVFSIGGTEAVATVNNTQTLPVTGLAVFINSCSNLIARILPSGTAPINGSTTAKVWIEGTQSTEYVKRHYEITPASNAATATATITLYFTQQEFTDFNAVNAIKLPIDAADLANNKANLLIEKASGVSSDGTGLPATYTDTKITINPDDANISWNAAASRWEVSFAVTGFSGFFAKTSSSLLPVTLNRFNVAKTTGGVLVSWQTSNEKNTSRFEVERSTNGINFEHAGTVLAKNISGVNNYTFIDNSPWVSEQRYYRLKPIDNDGAFKYSAVVTVSNKQRGAVTVYPNPGKDVFTISASDNKLLHTRATLTAANGKTVKSITLNEMQQTVPVSGLPAGIYMLRLANGAVIKLIKE